MDRPLDQRTRTLLLILLVPLLLAVIAPLWQMRFEAPQYPQGLELQIFSYTVAGDVQEVNTLNHYIGMAPIDRAALSDLDFLPFAIGVGALLDLLALYTYLGLFAFARFAYRLYVFGHQLDPKAPFSVEPFTPTIFGSGTVANFTISSWPARGSLYLGLVFAGLMGALVLTLRRRPAAAARGQLL